jgi:hypothetical protein
MAQKGKPCNIDAAAAQQLKYIAAAFRKEVYGREQNAGQELRGKRSHFTPQAISSMGQALEETTAILGVGGDETRRQAVAKFIIRVASEDGSLDAKALRDRAVTPLGGVAYNVLSASQTSNPRAAAE